MRYYIKQQTKNMKTKKATYAFEINYDQNSKYRRNGWKGTGVHLFFFLYRSVFWETAAGMQIDLDLVYQFIVVGAYIHLNYFE
jgi:hypothetical protein